VKSFLPTSTSFFDLLLPRDGPSCLRDLSLAINHPFINSSLTRKNICSQSQLKPIMFFEKDTLQRDPLRRFSYLPVLLSWSQVSLVVPSIELRSFRAAPIEMALPLVYPFRVLRLMSALQISSPLRSSFLRQRHPYPRRSSLISREVTPSSASPSRPSLNDALIFQPAFEVFRAPQKPLKPPSSLTTDTPLDLSLSISHIAEEK